MLGTLCNDSSDGNVDDVDEGDGDAHDDGRRELVELDCMGRPLGTTVGETAGEAVENAMTPWCNAPCGICYTFAGDNATQLAGHMLRPESAQASLAKKLRTLRVVILLPQEVYLSDAVSAARACVVDLVLAT